MKKLLVIFIVMFTFTLASKSQTKEFSGQEMYNMIKDGKGMIVYGSYENGEEIYTVKVKPIIIFSEREFKNDKEKKRYNKMERNIKKVYPYSLIIKNIFNESEFVLRNMDNEREKTKYIKIKEKELKKEFEDDIRDMTFTQGRILIKLVDRETTHTTYELVEHFKGGVSAIFWQSVARIFSTNLKYEYDPAGEDVWIEEIVVKIENGTL